MVQLDRARKRTERRYQLASWQYTQGCVGYRGARHQEERDWRCCVVIAMECEGPWQMPLLDIDCDARIEAQTNTGC